MKKSDYSFSPEGKKIYFIGIKGTGMAALAEMFKKLGAYVSGSDTEEKFYTDEVLKSLSIPFNEGFDSINVPADADLVVHSSAYSKDTNPELVEAVKKGLTVKEYTEALGAFSSDIKSCGIAGVHGKTTTTGILGTILKELDLPVSVLAGSAVSNFDGKSTFINGKSYFIAETCEYKRHFLSFHPDIILLTGIEPDHLDYFKDYNDIFSAFYEYAEKLPQNGTLIFCADNKGASELAVKLSKDRKDINIIPYGFTAEGDWRITSIKQKMGRPSFTLKGYENEFEVRVPGRHTVLNCAGSSAAASVIYRSIFAGGEKDFSAGNCNSDIIKLQSADNNRNTEKDGYSLPDSVISKISDGISAFSGSRRRSEILGEREGILFMDDYAHHPTALKTTIEGFRDFYPGRRIIVDFMSHTYSRTEALLDDFASSFGSADLVVINKIYSSARERGTESDLDKRFFNRVCDFHENVWYYEEPLSAYNFLKKELKKGDVFITMGAGDNWILGRKLFNSYKNGV